MDKTCTLLLLRRPGEVLLAMKKRGFGAGLWNGVGGKLDLGESIEQAMIRECQEEINVTPTSYQKVAVHDFLMDADTEQSWHMHVHAYLADSWEGEPIETEEMAPKWFKISEIPYKEMWQDDVFWLPAVLGGQKLRSKFRFDKANQLLACSLEIVKNEAELDR